MKKQEQSNSFYKMILMIAKILVNNKKVIQKVQNKLKIKLINVLIVIKIGNQ